MSNTLATIAAMNSQAFQILVRQTKAGDEEVARGANVSEGSTKDSLLDDELTARRGARHNFVYLLLINTYSAVVVFLVHLISVETLMSIAMSVISTYYVYETIDGKEQFDGAIMNWVLLSFAVITPLSATIGMAFTRREQALQSIADIRSTCFSLYSAHSIWDWGFETVDVKEEVESNSGKTKSTNKWLEHADKVIDELFEIGNELGRFLMLPNSTRARHKITSTGKKEADCTQGIGSRLHISLLVRLARLSKLCEVLKREGLPPNEATRIRQWERMLLDSIESLRMIKMYRTPQALRSFGRLFSIFLPPFYAPFYAQMATELQSLGTALAFAVITSIALTALFESVTQMEDPFVRRSVLDGIDVRKELADDFVPQLLALRKVYFPQASDIGTRQATPPSQQQPEPSGSQRCICLVSE